MIYANEISLVVLYVHVESKKMHIISFLYVKIILLPEILFSIVLFKLELVNIDLNLLLCGDVNLPLHINNKIFAAVHKFIDESCRFS